MNRRSWSLWVRLSALLGLVAGCSAMTHPEDIAVAEELCAKRGGYAHVARYEHGRNLLVNCKDGTHFDVRLAERKG
jgi:hypothetical protein